MSDMKTIDMKPKEFVDLEPAEFVKRFEKDRCEFKSFRIVGPKLGSADFGKIRVHLKTPIYSADIKGEHGR